jgi:hypothetical protein
MTRLRRRPRAVYRVYDEDEYLAGADPLPTWEEEAAAVVAATTQGKSPAGEPSHGRRLQRLAGAAALTGAVATVGGVEGLAGLRTHAAEPREIAQRVMPSARAAALRGNASTPVRAMRRQTLHPTRPASRQMRRGKAPSLSHGSASRVQTDARTIAVSASTATAARESAVRFTRAREASSGESSSTQAPSAAPGASAETASATAQTPSAATEARPRAQSEFGFER